MYRVLVNNGNGDNVVYTADSYLVGEYSCYNIVDPVLTLADNEAGSFVFTLPANNARYDASKSAGVRLMESEIKIDRRFRTSATTKTWQSVWRGRAISEESDFEKNRVITCEGELNYLKDTRQPQRYYDFSVKPGEYLDNLLKFHTSKVDKKKAFYYGGCSSRYRQWVDSYDRKTTTEGRSTQFQDTLSLIKSLVDELAAHIVIKWENSKRYLYLYDNDDWLTETTQPAVRLGANLLDFTKKFKMDEMATVIVPLGEKLDDGTTSDKVGAVIFDQETANTKSYASNAVLTETTAKTPTKSAVNPNNSNQVWDESSKTYVNKESGDVTDYSSFYLYGPYTIKYNSDGELEDQYLYYTGRMRNGYVKYLIRNNKNEIMAVGTSTSGSEPDDSVEEQIEIPVGSTKIWIAGYGNDINLRLNKCLKSDDSNAQGLDEYVTVDEVNNKSPYVVNKKLVAKYGWIEQVVEFPGITSPKELLQKAKKYLRSDQFEDISMEVKMIDRYYFDHSTPALEIGNNVRVISPEHDLDEFFPVSKMEIHLLEPDQSTYTLGLEKKTQISIISSVSKSETAETIKATEAALSDRLQAARDSIAEVINKTSAGYVTLKRSADGSHIEEIIISEYDNYLEPAVQNIWKWGAGGLVFSNKGYHPEKNKGSWKLGITADGQICADLITAGSLSADMIEGGELMIGKGDPDNQIAFYAARAEGSDINRNKPFVFEKFIQMSNSGIEILNPFYNVYPGRFASPYVGTISNGGDQYWIRGKDGYDHICYRSNGADDLKIKAYNQVLIESDDNMFLIPKGDGHLYTGSDQTDAYNNGQYGVTEDITVSKVFVSGLQGTYNLKFVNGLLVGCDFSATT